MDTEANSTVDARITRTTYLSIGANILMFVLKIFVGLVSGSMALLADGVHSLSDMATDVAVLFGHRLGSKAPDENHPYGHGRIETFSALFVAVFLIVVGGGMIYVSALDMAKGNRTPPHVGILVVAILSIGVKEALYRISIRVAKQSRSSAMYANAWHHRSDALSSIAVVFGFIALKFGFVYGDQLAATGVGIMVILVGVQVVGESLNELTESAVDKDSVKLIEAAINNHQDIRDWHKLRTRSVGREIFLDLHILVDPELKVTAAHDIAETLEKSIADQLPCQVNMTIHIEPDLPQLRL